MKIEEVFCDGVSRINITGPVVRIEFGAFDIPEDENAPAPENLEPRHRLVMPLEGFLKGFELFERVVNDMIERNVVVRGGSEDDAGKPASGGKTVSPNFS